MGCRWSEVQILSPRPIRKINGLQQQIQAAHYSDAIVVAAIFQVRFPIAAAWKPAWIVGLRAMHADHMTHAEAYLRSMQVVGLGAIRIGLGKNLYSACWQMVLSVRNCRWAVLA